MNEAAAAIPSASNVTAAATPERRRLQILVWALFLSSGACALIYEVLWCRQLGLIFGNTAHSISTVLTAFMGGLALGSFLGGRLAHRFERPFMVYGVLEIAIGVYCAALPLLFGDSSPLVPLYRSLYGADGSSSLVAVRLVVSFILLIIPTTFMGMTLPLLTQFLVRSKSTMGKTVGTLYALNTLGAVVGAVLAGFILLPHFGKVTTNWIAVVLNLLLGVVAVVLGAKERVPAYQPEKEEVPQQPGGENTASAAVEQPAGTPLPVKLAVATFGLTGFAAMATQIGWTKAISLGTGSSTYAFSLIIGVFILGLSAGGAYGARVAAKTTDAVGALGRCLLQIGLLNLIVAVMLGVCPILFYVLIAWTSQISWNWVLLSQAGGIAGLIILPTFFMGMTMPLTMQVVSRLAAAPARTAGTVYAINTLGAILGSAMGGLVLIPLLRIQTTLEVMAFFYAVPGAILFWLSPSRKNSVIARPMYVLAGLIVLFAAIGPRWDDYLMSSGIYLMRDPVTLDAVRKGDVLAALPKRGKDESVTFYREGAEATVAVFKSDADLSLRVGGKPDATAYGDKHTQVCLTLIPAMLHESGPKDVLVIGLGSGVSAGAALAPSTVQQVDAVEMSPEVVKASGLFSHVNGLKYKTLANGDSWIDTPRCNLIVNDGRNHLLLTNRSYDIIASEPSNPWMAGIGNLFTREAFELAKKRLKPGGIMCQWIHTYRLDAAHIYSVIKTFGDVFQNIQVWNSKGGDLLLIGSESELRIPIERLRERMKEPSLKPWLEQMHYEQESELLAGFLAHDTVLRKRSQSAQLHTDDNMLLEFNAPRAQYTAFTPFRVTSFHMLLDKVVDVSALPPAGRMDFQLRTDRAIAAREHYYYSLVSNYMREEHLRTAAILAPNQYWAVEFLGQQAIEKSKKLAGGQNDLRQDYEEALRILEEASVRATHTRFPKTLVIEIRVRMIEDYLNHNNSEAALKHLAILREDYTKIGVRRGHIALLLLKAFYMQGKYDAAVNMGHEAFKTGGDTAETARWLYKTLVAQGNKTEANVMIKEANRALFTSSQFVPADLLVLEARGALEANDPSRALKLAQEAKRFDATNIDAALMEADLLIRAGQLEDGLVGLQKTLAIDPQGLASKMALVQGLLVFAKAKSEDDKRDVARDMLKVARRVCVEAAVLHPNANEPWIMMARVCKALHTYEGDKAPETLLQAKQAVEKVLPHFGGDKTLLPTDVTDLLD
jgi:spermidine synthase